MHNDEYGDYEEGTEEPADSKADISDVIILKQFIAGWKVTLK